MKKCPFCAEQIQDEAIKCKHCGENLTGDPHPAAGGAAPARAAATPEDDLLYAGHPSWRAYIKEYTLVCLLAPLAAAGGLLIALRVLDDATVLVKILSLVVPLAVGAVAFAVVTLRRRARKLRITTKGVEMESGIFAKRIEVMEAWRITDVTFRQSLLDRILGISHIDVVTSDKTTPNITLFGLPASRQLFEQLRESALRQSAGTRSVMRVIE